MKFGRGRRFQHALVCATILVLASACTPPHAALEVRDPEGNAAASEELTVRDDGGELIASWPLTDGFPVSVTLESAAEGTRALIYEARDLSGEVVGRMRHLTSFSKTLTARVALDLQRPCADESVCDDGVFCNGRETCSAGVCAGREPVCPGTSVTCVSVSCDEVSDTCTFDPDHSQCDGVVIHDETGDVLPGYCDIAYGCRAGRACSVDADCDDGLGCTGADICVNGGVCVIQPFTVIDDDNPCTTDVCIEPGMTENRPENGLTCTLPGEEFALCQEGTCLPFVPVPPPPAAFTLRDPVSSSTTVALVATVDVHVLSSAEGFLIEEGETDAPDAEDPRFQNEAPTSFTLSAGDGVKVVTLWTRNTFGLVNDVPARREITLSTDVTPIGPGPLACPAPAGPCAYDGAVLPNVIQSAIDASSPGDILWLYPGTYSVPSDDRVAILHSLTIESAPETSPDDIWVNASQDGGSEKDIFQLYGDNITLRGFSIRLNVRRHWAIDAFVGGATAGSTGHLLERLHVHGETYSAESWNYRQGAVRLAGATTLRNSVFDGYLRKVVQLGDADYDIASGAIVTHNTFVIDEPIPAVQIEHASDVALNNNLWVTTKPDAPAAPTETAAVCTDVCTNVTADANAFSGYAADVAPPIVGGAAFALNDDGLVSLSDLRPHGASPLVDAVLFDDVGMLDFYGRPRQVGERVDIGAVERQEGELIPRRTSPIRVGISDMGCDGPCDEVRPTFEDNAIARAVASSRSGDVIQLFGQEGASVRYRVRGVVIHRRVTIEPGPGVDRRGVRLDDGEGQGTMFIVAIADDVTFRNLTFECYSCGAVRAYHKEGGSNAPDYIDARATHIENVSFLAEWVGWCVTAFEVGDGATVDNLAARGSIKEVVSFFGSNNRMTGATIHSLKCDNEAPLIDVRGVTETTIANSLIVFDGGIDHPRVAFGGDDTTANITFDHNMLFDVDVAGQGVNVPLQSEGGTTCVTALPETPPGTLCAASDPGFVDMSGEDFRLTASSPAVDTGNNDMSWVSTDVLGQPRVTGTSIDIGAFEYAP